MKKVFTCREVAEIFGVCSNTIRRYEKRGVIKAFRTLGGHRRFRRQEVERLRKLLGDDGTQDMETSER